MSVQYWEIVVSIVVALGCGAVIGGLLVWVLLATTVVNDALDPEWTRPILKSGSGGVEIQPDGLIVSYDMGSAEGDVSTYCVARPEKGGLCTVIEVGTVCPLCWNRTPLE